VKACLRGEAELGNQPCLGQLTRGMLIPNGQEQHYITCRVVVGPDVTAGRRDEPTGRLRSHTELPYNL
jgi:hypothetical protein